MAKAPRNTGRATRVREGVFGQGAKAGIYARVSTHDQQTLPMQVRALREYAERRDWTVASVVEDVASGASERVRRDEMLLAAKRREIDVILVWKLDRFGRSTPDLLTSLQDVAAAGAGFVSYTEGFDLTTPSGKALAGMLAVFAEFERDLIKERVKAGMAEARARGVRLGRPPSARENASLVLTMSELGESQSGIARELGIGRGSVQRILSQRE
jgi:putative DNA-invertase from lambdoid prophage Rac